MRKTPYLTNTPSYCQILSAMLSNEELLKKDLAFLEKIERKVTEQGRVWGWQFRNALSRCRCDSIPQRLFAQRLGVTWRTFLKWKHTKDDDAIPLPIDTLERALIL